MNASNLPAPPTHTPKWPWEAVQKMLKRPIGYPEELIKLHGDSFYLTLPYGKAIWTANPDFIKHVLQTNHKNYEKERGYDVLALLLGRGLVTSRGALWKKQRKIAQPTFYKKSLADLYQAMLTVTDNYIAELETKRGAVLDISREMMAVTAKIAMKALFSKDLEGNLKDIYQSIAYSQEYITNRITNPLATTIGFFTGANRRFKKQVAVMDKLIYGLIEERRNSKTKQADFLQMLMDARYEDTGEPMPEDLLRDELVTIFSAGHETSSNGLTWTLYLLSQHPEIMTRLRAEVHEVLGDKTPSIEQLKDLVYTKQVIEEGMRLYPPVWIVGRYAKAQDEFMGFDLRPKRIVFCMIYHLHRHEALWEAPNEFRPERFEVAKAKARPSKYYLPFGAGPRMCIGNHFAMMEMQLLLVRLIQQFDFELIPNQRIVLNPRITVGPKYGINMKIV